MDKVVIKNLEFKATEAPQIEVIELSELVKRNQNLLFAPHRTEFFHLFIFEDCHPLHIIDFKPTQIEPNSLLFLNKGIVHQFDEKRNYQGWLIVFTDSFYCQSTEDLDYLNRNPLFNDIHDNPFLKVSGTIINRILKITAEINLKQTTISKPLLTRINQNLLHNILLLAENEKNIQESSPVLKTKDLEYYLTFKSLLVLNLKEEKTVTFYAKQMHITERRLYQTTTTIAGKTPKEIIDQYLLLEAKRLLAQNKKNIKEIAYELGFKEPTNFIKYFKKQTSQTPIEFKASC